MAIDTAAKRSSCLDYEEVWSSGIPLPDGIISQADRQHLLWSYSGILAAASIPGVFYGNDIYALWRDKRMLVPGRDKRVAVLFRDKRITDG